MAYLRYYNLKALRHIKNSVQTVSHLIPCCQEPMVSKPNPVIWDSLFLTFQLTNGEMHHIPIWLFKFQTNFIVRDWAKFYDVDLNWCCSWFTADYSWTWNFEIQGHGLKNQFTLVVNSSALGSILPAHTKAKLTRHVQIIWSSRL